MDDHEKETKVHNNLGKQTCKFFHLKSEWDLVWSASTHLTEYSLASFYILKLVLARTRVASTKRVMGGASFKLSK